MPWEPLGWSHVSAALGALCPNKQCESLVLDSQRRQAGVCNDYPFLQHASEAISNRWPVQL